MLESRNFKSLEKEILELDELDSTVKKLLKERNEVLIYPGPSKTGDNKNKIRYYVYTRSLDSKYPFFPTD